MGRPKRVKISGRARMKQLGCKEVQLYIDPRELGLMQAAANSEGKKLATWIREKAFHAAEDAARIRQREEAQPT